MGLGRSGITFSLLGRKYSPHWIYAALEQGMESHDGQATVFELNDLYHWSEIEPDTHFVGVIGFGPTETGIARVFNAGFKQLGLNTRCLPLAVGDFDQFARRLDTLGINTILVSPALGAYVLDLTDQDEDAAQHSGFADLLLKRKESGWTAYNTIWRSALKAVEDKLGRKNAEDRPLDRCNMLVVGATGTAQAMIHGIHRRKGIASVTAPDDKKAQRVARKVGVRCVPFASLYDTLADVVILTDPNLIAGYTKSEMNPSYLWPHMTLLDVCRLPEDSAFSTEARERGCKIVEPADVYIDQLSAQFKVITGQELPAEAYQAVRPQEGQSFRPPHLKGSGSS